MGRGLGTGRLRRAAGGQWVVDYTTANGERRRQGLGPDKQVAERRKAELIRQRDLELDGLGTVERKDRLLREVRDRYLADLVLRSSPHHYKNAQHRIDRFLRQVRITRVRDLQPHHVLLYRTRRVGEGAAHATVNNEVRNLKAMINWGVRSGLLAMNPIEHLAHLPQGSKYVRRRRRAMSEDEIERFLEAARDDDRVQQAHVSAEKTIGAGTKGSAWASRQRRLRIPQAPMWHAFLESGGRYGELTRTLWSDIDFDRRTLGLRAEETKSGRPRTIPLRDGLLAELDELRAIQARVLGRELLPGDRLFLTPDGAPCGRTSRNTLRMFNKLLERAGIAKVDAQGRSLDVHATRVSFASRLARSGAPLIHAQKLLGHSDPALTSRVYSHLDADDMRGSVERMDAHPLRSVAQSKPA